MKVIHYLPIRKVLDMKEITGVSGGCADQARIGIRFDLKGKLKKLVGVLIGEGFLLSID